MFSLGIRLLSTISIVGRLSRPLPPRDVCRYIFYTKLDPPSKAIVSASKRPIDQRCIQI